MAGHESTLGGAPSGELRAGDFVRLRRSAGTTTLLIDALRAVRWPDALAGHPASRFVWAAGEFDTAQAVRQWAREERGLEKHEQLVVAYWRRGMSESDFKAAK